MKERGEGGEKGVSKGGTGVAMKDKGTDKWREECKPTQKPMQ